MKALVDYKKLSQQSFVTPKARVEKPRFSPEPKTRFKRKEIESVDFGQRLTVTNLSKIICETIIERITIAYTSSFILSRRKF